MSRRRSSSRRDATGAFTTTHVRQLWRWNAAGYASVTRNGCPAQQQEARIKLINRDERKYGIGLTRKRFCAPPAPESPWNRRVLRIIFHRLLILHQLATKLMEIRGNSSFGGGGFLIYFQRWIATNWIL